MNYLFEKYRIILDFQGNIWYNMSTFSSVKGNNFVLLRIIDYLEENK